MKAICSKVPYRWELCPRYTCHIRCDTPKRQSLVPVSAFQCLVLELRFYFGISCSFLEFGMSMLHRAGIKLQLLKKSTHVDDDALQAIPHLEGVMWPTEFILHLLKSSDLHIKASNRAANIAGRYVWVYREGPLLEKIDNRVVCFEWHVQ